MNLTQEIKDLARQSGLDYVGIAPVDRFINAPEGHKPTDLLPGARSVVSMSIKLSKGSLLTMIRGFVHRELRHTSFAYRFFGYGLLNMFFMDRTAFLVAQLLEKEGHIALPIAASGVGSSRDYVAQFSNRHAAVAAGIGEFGWIGLCLTPQNGPRQRFVSVITTADLDPDPMYSGPKLCDVEKCKALGQGTPLCIKYCPMHAYSRKKTKEVVIGGVRMEYADLNFHACASVHNHIVDTDHVKDTYADDGRNPLFELEAKYELERQVYRRGHGCAGCLFVCPVGLPKEIGELVDRELKPDLSRRFKV